MGHRRSFVLAGLLLLGLSASTAEAVVVLEGPTLVMNPSGVTPLAGRVDLTVDEPVQVQFSITYLNETRVVSFPQAAQVHQLPLLGLKPDRTYSVDVEMIPGGPAGSFLATTPQLPEDFPTLQTHVSTPESMEPGYVLLDCFFRSAGDTRLGYTIIVDELGEVVWYSTLCMRTPHRLPNGDLFYQSGTRATQMDLLGRRRRNVLLQMPAGGLHHDFFPTPHGTILSLTYEGVEVEDFPTSETDPGAPLETVLVRDEPVVEFFPDGTIRKQWSILDLIDPTRIAYNSLNPSDMGADWVHTNAVTYRQEDDSIIVSGRHQDAVFKYSRETGDLQWILGNHENWAGAFEPFLLDPVSTPFRWQYHQHAPMWTPQGTLLLFDNGNFRASPFDGTTPVPDDQNFSRAVEYEIDEDLMQVQQVWEYGENAPEQIYSWFISDADSQPQTGNRLITFGGVSHVGGVSSMDLGLGEGHARIIETTDATPATTVFDLSIHDPTGGRIGIYRSEKILDLYPSEEVFPPNGVGPTLRLDRADGASVLSWVSAPTDSGHHPADYYIVYASEEPGDGFFIRESKAATVVHAADSASAIEFYTIVSANIAGTSGDEPALASAAE